MERLGDHFRENLPIWQPRIEEMLEVKLGNVEIKPLSDLPQDYFIKYTDGFSQADRKYLRIAAKVFVFVLEGAAITAKAEPGTVYYARDVLSSFLLTNSRMTETLVHELAHVAHFAVTGKHFGMPQHLVEGFAERVMRELCPQRQSYSLFFRHYDKYLTKFEYETKHLNSISEIKQFMIEKTKPYL